MMISYIKTTFRPRLLTGLWILLSFFMIVNPGSKLSAQIVSILSIEGERDVEAGTQTTYSVRTFGIPEQCLTYRWKANGGTVVGESNRPTFSVKWKESGDVKVAVSVTDEGSCPVYASSALLPVTVNSANLCQIPLNMHLNCVMGYITAGPLDPTKLSWTDDFDDNVIRIVEDGQVLRVTYLSGQCTDRTVSYTVDKSLLLQSCYDCKDSFVEKCVVTFQ